MQDVAALGDYVYETMPRPALQILQADAYLGGPLVALPKVLQSPSQEVTSAVKIQMSGLSVIQWTYKKMILHWPPGLILVGATGIAIRTPSI